LLSHEIAFLIHRERQREIERKLAILAMPASQIENRSIRWRVGQAMIRAGSALASDAPVALTARR